MYQEKYVTSLRMGQNYCQIIQGLVQLCSFFEYLSCPATLYEKAHYFRVHCNICEIGVFRSLELNWHSPFK